MDHDTLPLWRLHLLRAFYLLVTLGLACGFGPLMLQHSDVWPPSRAALFRQAGAALALSRANPSPTSPSSIIP
jgi:hypothetical protein